MESQATQKRQRGPLSHEGNVLSSSESDVQNDLKRRRLTPTGAENQEPQGPDAMSPSRQNLRRAELEMKPDTPAVPSIRSRLQQLAQRREGGAAPFQRCLSDPGAQGPSGGIPDLLVESSRPDICHIGEGEFSSRLELFKAPTPIRGDPSRPLARTVHGLSGFVHSMQQQLLHSEPRSASETTRIRKEREVELGRLNFQPITENLWLNRSRSDPSLSDDESEDAGGRVGTDGAGGAPCRAPLAHTATPCLPNRQPELELSCSEEMSTSAMIDKMFEDVLQAADPEEPGQEEDEAEKEEEDVASSEMVSMKTEPAEEAILNQEDEEEEEESQEEDQPASDNGEEDGETEDEAKDDCVEDQEGEDEYPPEHFDGGEKCTIEEGEEGEGEEEEEEEEVQEEDFLSLPPRCVLSPLSKSVEAVVTPLRLATAESKPSAILLPTETPPLYSIDAYRSQRRTATPSTQSVTPVAPRRAQDRPRPKPPINAKERIKVLSEEAARLQAVIGQTLQALGCCTDEEHGKGSLEEAEAEKLLLVSSEKRTALLAEVARLREGVAGRAEGVATETGPAPLQPCRGTVTISSVKLPLKVEFVCSARTGRPTHYFLILFRYGPCNIVATPLATAADALNGDTISFPTQITLQDIRSNFEIDVEVYSLSHTAGHASNTLQQSRTSTKSRVTPKKILHSMKKPNYSLASATLPLNTRQSSSFSLVGSHKITLASLGSTKFPLDKMKFEGKIRRLLGDEFQEKVPFLSPLEGHVYLQLQSQGHSSVLHDGFLTMFEDVSGFGAWHRLYFILEGAHLLNWHHPNEKDSKPAEGSIALSQFTGQCVKPVPRESCARPHTFELASTRTQQEGEQDQPPFRKCWFSADTREERSVWMEKLSQVLLDLNTWSRPQIADGEEQEAGASSNRRDRIRESML